MNKGVRVQSQNHKKDGSKSHKKHNEKFNLDINLYSKENKFKNKFSIEKLQKLFKKGTTNIKNLNLKKNSKFPINNFINLGLEKNISNAEKITTNSNSNLKKMTEKKKTKKKILYKIKI